jgi:hypothetical protein
MDSPNSLRDAAERLRAQATDQFHSAADDGKARASAMLAGVVQAAHDVAERFGPDETSAVARYTRKAATTVDELASALRDKSVDELVSDGRAMIRNSPALAIGVAVAAGFALSRFLKASEPVKTATVTRLPHRQGA